MSGVDKLFLPLGGRPLLAWCVETLERHSAIDDIVISIAAERMDEARRLKEQRGWRKVRLVTGGARRQDSVARALELLGQVDWVLVHDGDRPFLETVLVDSGLRAARETGVAVAAVPVKDTVKSVDGDGLVVATLDRDALRAVQTPQVFRADIIRRAYAAATATVTDDAMLAERLGYPVRLYEGSYDNLKVTTPDDIIVAETIARRWEARR
jgi:2-C-methyl-D-erythritol 4-phosphate cytidylyltransferase